ncbi:MAG: signal peptidase II [Clostridiales bacterium]|nr:signal peptidase II [Clostridiales bacterium]
MKRKPWFILYLVMCPAFVGVDQFLKYLVQTRLALGEAWPSADRFARILHVQNDGVAFSLFAGNPQALIALQSVLFIAIAVLAVFAYRRRFSPAIVTGLTWIVAGGAGNLVDRIRYGYVVDFIAVGNFPVWNFADMCVVGGCILIGISVLFFWDRDRPPRAEAGDDR